MQNWNANWNSSLKCKSGMHFEMQIWSANVKCNFFECKLKFKFELQIWNADLKYKLKCNFEMQNWNAILKYNFNMQV